MNSPVDEYLDALLAFVPRNRSNRFTKDYIALIHVPAQGAEKVYSIVHDDVKSLLTVASFQKPLWERLDSDAASLGPKPELDALQAEVESDHPVMDYLQSSSLRLCESYGDGRPGLDYYLMLWQKDGEAGVVECYEPYSREDYSWAKVIGAMQVLASQFEYELM
ncbi:hypothetical protein [Pelagicoccus albus]|uniref:Uncharacterized protein n=1 Tax=Pelagicoccus albus TaxID=415222 RepID=A0A7X1B5K8_9BACT|nr:hypothetical protein [Pelagicoccus albus]MBC2606040.1 hypothetical protein [Pelagicoccus albus]